MTNRLPAVAPPNLPNPGDTYTRAHGDTLNNVLRLYFTRLSSTLNAVVGNEGGQYLSFPYGSFISTATQTAAAANTAYSITFNSTLTSNSVVVNGGDTSKLVVDEDGLYNFQFSLQLEDVNASDKNAWFWPRVNGVDIANSATKVNLRASTKEMVAAWNFFVPMNATDYFQLMWAADSTDVSIIAMAATGFAPAVPSAIMTVNFISTLATA